MNFTKKELKKLKEKYEGFMKDVKRNKFKD